ncbi:MAG: CHAP domain-containing protein [Rothia mucilaginosa]|uniref:CHAP domain-containing protein n=1 Tax=Rothia mucilaginosa TaxID=43675 RepID=A0A930PS05_9MICC|nr:CHAP domain-containing protein [Rothia mucilaginosa]MBF1659999.1 CHAP domain-containing protein [Rothia mucilaginosa]
MDEQKKGAGPLLVGIAVVAVGLVLGPILGIIILFGGVLGGNSANAACRPASASAAAGGGGEGEGGQVDVTIYDDDGSATTRSESSRVGGKIPNDWEQYVVWASLVSGVPTSWIAAQIEAESGWDPTLGANHAGASGLTQFIPSTWETYGHGGSPNDPQAAIRAMGEFLRDLRSQLQPVIDAHPDVPAVELMMAGYNAGPGAVQNYNGVPPYSETQTYLSRIRGLASIYAKTYGSEVGGKSDGSVEKGAVPYTDDTANVTGGQAGSSNNCSPQNYSGGKVSGTDDYPWAGYVEAANPITGMYYVNCTDFSLWRLNQQVGATDPNHPKYTNGNFASVPLGNGGEWATAWRAKGWPADNTPEVGAMAHFAPGAVGASQQYGHIAVVLEVHDNNTVTIEEYNGATPYKYSTRTVPADQVTTYLHIPDSEKVKKD